jgi:hypothetical protein
VTCGSVPGGGVVGNVKWPDYKGRFRGRGGKGGSH